MAVNENEKTVDAPIIAAIHGARCQLVTGQIQIFKDLLECKIFKNLVPLVGGEMLVDSVVNYPVDKDLVILRHFYVSRWTGFSAQRRSEVRR